MLNTVDRLMRRLRRKAILITALLVFISFSSCVDSLNQGGSEGPPIGFQQILLNVLPSAIFGNSCEFAEIEAIFNELLTPSGATIQVELNSPDLPFELRGCITSSGVVVINGRAFIDYLGGPLVGPEFVGFVNVGVTVTLPNGVKQSSFVPVTIVGVGIIDIFGPTTITANPLGDPSALPVFATIQVNTQGIMPGTFVDFEVTDPTCGNITNPTPVIGSTAQGVAIAQYNAFDGEECTQTVLIEIILPDPSEKSSACDPVPVGLRTIQASITFTQVVGPLPTPTPSPGPTPSPTPTPIVTIDVQAFNTLLAPGDSTLTTATVNTGSNTPVCCDIPFNSDPESFLTLGMITTPPAVCGLTDVNGDLFTILTAGDVVTDQFVQVRCCIDSNATANACDPTDVAQDTEIVDISPAGVPPPITLVASPSTIPPNGTSTITASTTPPVPVGTNICFEIVINSQTDPSNLFNTGPPFCFGATSGGQAVVGLQGGNVTTQEGVTVLGCIDISGAMDDCDGTDPSNFVTVVVSPPTPTPTPAPTAPPAPAITIVATDSSPPPLGTPFINVFTSSPPLTVLCVDILVDSTTGGSSLTGPFVFPPNACDLADAFGDSIGFIQLTISGAAISGQSISLQGCIDSNFDGSCFGEILSPVIFVTVP